MKVITTIAFFLLLPLSDLYPQAPDTLWTKTFGGVSNDLGYSVQQTTDGGYIICGVTESFGMGYYDIWLIKTNTSGELLWTKTFGGIYNDYGHSIQQTTDSGYIICGYKETLLYGFVDVLLIKTNASGELLWQKTFGGVYDQSGSEVQQTSDGGYIVCGSIYSLSGQSKEIWLIKTDSSGDTLWTKAIGGVYWDFGTSVEQTSDDGYIVTGILNYGNNFTDAWLIKTDAYGDTLWTKTFGPGLFNELHSVQQTTDGGYILIGNFDIGSGDPNVWLLKTNAYGDTLWTKTFEGNGVEFGKKVWQTPDGGYIICGTTGSFGAGSYDVWLIKTDVDGEIIWTKTFGGSLHDLGEAIQQTTDGGYIITGATYSFGAGYYDVWLIKTTPDVSGIEPNNELISTFFSLSQNYPNPFNPSTKISWQSPVGSWQTLKIYDVLGNEVATLVDEYKPAGSYQVEWNASGFPSGVYFYQLRSENFFGVKKLILIK